MKKDDNYIDQMNYNQLSLQHLTYKKEHVLSGFKLLVNVTSTLISHYTVLSGSLTLQRSFALRAHPARSVSCWKRVWKQSVEQLFSLVFASAFRLGNKR